MPGKQQIEDTAVLSLEGGRDNLRIEGEIVEGGLKLFLDCERTDDGEGECISYEELHQLLVEHVPDNFLHHDVIREIVQRLNRGEPAGRRRVAKGKAPIDGRDGKLLYLVKKYDSMSSAGDQLEPRFVRYFDNIVSGTVIARIYPPTAGKEGMDVFMNPLYPEAGSAVEIELDESVRREPPRPGESFERLVASCDGYAAERFGKVSVEGHLRIRGDIDYRVGDLSFIGSIELDGDVMKGFRVDAKRDINVKGNVYGGLIHSASGDVTVDGAITVDETADAVQVSSESIEAPEDFQNNSQSSIQVRAGGGVHASTLLGACVLAKGSIHVQKEVYCSKLRTGASLLLSAGALIAGEVSAVCGVEARSIGTKKGTATRINLLSDAESSVEYEELTASAASHEKAEKMIELFLGPYVDENRETPELAPDHRKRLALLRAKLRKVRDSKALLFERQEKLLSSAKYNSTLRVNVIDTLYPGVTIRVKDAEYVSSESKKGPLTIEYHAEREEFEVGSLEPLICDFES